MYLISREVYLCEDTTQYHIVRICSSAEELEAYKISLSNAHNEYLDNLNKATLLKKRHDKILNETIENLCNIEKPTYVDTASLNRAILVAKENNDLAAYELAKTNLAEANNVNLKLRNKYKDAKGKKVNKSIRVAAENICKLGFTKEELSLMDKLNLLVPPLQYTDLRVDEVGVDCDLNIVFDRSYE